MFGRKGSARNKHFRKEKYDLLSVLKKEQQGCLPENRERIKITVEISELENRKAIEKPVQQKAASLL